MGSKNPSSGGARHDKPEAAPGKEGISRRVLRGVGVGLLCLAGVLLAFTVLLQVAGVRRAVLHYALPIAAHYVPGELEIEEALWPALEAFRFTGICWTDNGDTVLAADTVALDIRIWPLLSGDIKAGYVIAHGLYVDVAGVRKLASMGKGAGEGEVPSRDAGDESGGFPRRGAVPYLPSVAVDSISITGPSIDLTQDSGIADLALAGGFDFSHGGTAEVRVRKLKARAKGDEWRINDMSLVANLSQGTLKGSGSGALAGDYALVFEAESPAPDEFIVKLGPKEGPESQLNQAPPDQPGMRAEIKLEREGDRLTGIRYDIALLTPSTDNLAVHGALKGRLAELPATQGITARVTGRALLEPRLAVDAHCEFSEPAYVERGMVALHYEERVANIDNLSLVLPQGLAISTAAAIEKGDVIRVTIEPIIVVAVATGGETAAAIGGHTAPRTGSDTTPNAAARAMPGDRTARHPTGENTGSITYSTITGDLTIEGLRVAGDYGNLTLDGQLDGRRTGTLRLKADWPEPPARLFEVLHRREGSPESLRDSLEAAWAADAPYRVDAEITLSGSDDPEGDRSEVRAAASLVLPGPRSLKPLLPREADVADLGPLTGDMELRAVMRDTLSEFDFTMDLARTDWVDTSIIHIAGAGDSIKVRDFLIRAQALRLALQGGFDRKTGAGSAAAEFSDAGFLRRFSQAIPDMDLKIDGTFAAPAREGSAEDHIEGPAEAHIMVEGSITGEAYEIPSLLASLDRDDAGTRGMARLPQGLLSRYVSLDAVEVDYSSTAAKGYFPAAIAIAARGKEYEVRQRAVLDLGDTVICAVDTLRLAAYGKDLEALQPFLITVERETGAFAVENMHLAGTAGQVIVDGFARTDSVNLTALIAIDLPESPPPGLDIPEGAWPDRLDAMVEVPGAGDINVSAAVDGLVLDDGSVASLNFELTAGDSDVVSSVTMDDGKRTLLEGDFSLPAVVTAYPPKMVYRAGDVSVRMKIDGYPLMFREAHGGVGKMAGLIARVDADVSISGNARDPSAYVGADVSFPDWPEMSDFNISAQAAIRPDAIRDATLAPRAKELKDRVQSNLGIERAETLVGEFGMSRTGQAMVEAYFSYPVTFAFDPLELRTAEGNMNGSLRSGGLPLEEIDLLLPPELGLDGTCAFEFSGSGNVRDPDVSGRLELADSRVTYMQLLEIVMGGIVKVEGTLRRPVFRGDLAIRNGLINIPKAPREMHPAEGRSILLDTAWRPGAARAEGSIGEADSIPGSGADAESVRIPPREKPLEVTPPGATARREIPPVRTPPVKPAPGRSETTPAAAPFKPDYDVTLDIGRGFWLRGEGLEIEFEGKLNITQKENVPVLAGDLKAMRGTFLFLGRVFNLEGGTISFYGETEMNPSLNIIVTSAIENYNIFIRLGGTLKKPELELRSDPDLPEGDIMAMIVFGKPLESLNEGQGNMLKERATDILLTMGAARLQQSLAGQTGLDVISVRSARGESDQGTALVVGKYITPDLLVSYEQALKEKSTSYIVMEYTLTRYIKLETLYSNQSRTGLGVSLEKDY